MGGSGVVAVFLALSFSFLFWWGWWGWGFLCGLVGLGGVVLGRVTVLLGFLLVEFYCNDLGWLVVFYCSVLVGLRLGGLGGEVGVFYYV